MKLFWSYLVGHRRLIAVLGLFCGVFAASFALYRLPMKAVIYPMLLCLLLGAIFLVIDFFRVRRRHTQLVRLQSLSSALISQLPSAQSVEETDYQALIRTLQGEIAALETQSAARYHNTVDYYTVWAHQIKTPIASMGLALQNEDTPLARRLSADLLRIEQYVNMVLAFLRLDSPSSDYVFTEHPIDDIVGRALSKFAPEFIDRKLTLTYEPLAFSAVTDDKWLCFVVEQILSNALKYTRVGGIKLYAQAPKTLCIEDSGMGIAPEDLPRVFEQGYTGYNGRRDNRASGLGLYLCKRICKNLGADIRIRSKLGQGTVVYIDLDQHPLQIE